MTDHQPMPDLSFPQQRPLKLLYLQPFHTGSHKAFAQEWIKHSQCNWELLSLPGRHWKWRMRHASIWMADKVSQILKSRNVIDAIVATDMLNVAEFQSLLTQQCKPNVQPPIPIILYFHENQYSYPARVSKTEQTRDEHFGFTNFVSALAADRCWFNSRFNLDTFLDSLKDRCRRWPDFAPNSQVDSLVDKCDIVYPGVELPRFDIEKVNELRVERARQGEPIRLVWAARWEHDKGPERLLKFLQTLEARSLDYQISVLGESFSKIPDSFSQIKNEFEHRLVQWGYLDSKDAYWEALASSDLFLSTAEHEFFGLSAVEAMTTGLVPLLPARLAYPELIELVQLDPDLSLYRSLDSLEQEARNAVNLLETLCKLREQNPQQWALSTKVCERLRSLVGWNKHASRLDLRLMQLVANL